MKKEVKERIISVATELFTKEGYDNIKMEDIAAKAGVTKMMLYYYFNNKQEILKTIIKNLMESAIVKISEMEFEKEFLLSSSSFIQRINSVIEDKRMFLAFVFSEVIKGNLADFPIFNYLKEFYDKIIGIFSKSKKQKEKDNEKLYIYFLFFSSIPLISFYALKEKVGREFGISKEKMEKDFIERFIQNIKWTLNLL
jgi:AcrR family transcriptional regulator